MGCTQSAARAGLALPDPPKDAASAGIEVGRPMRGKLLVKKAHMWVSSRRSRWPFRYFESHCFFWPTRFAKSEAFVMFSHLMLIIQSMSAHMLR